MMILPRTKLQIKDHALRSPTEECCGFVFEDGEIYRSPNLADNKSNRFVISSIAYIKAARIGKIYAVYHSHISHNYNFSEFDKLNADNHRSNYLVYSIQSDTFNFYPHNSSVNKYSGFDFEIGKNDCYSLVKNYWKAELNFEIIDGGLADGRGDDWLQKNPRIFEDIFDLNEDKLVRLKIEKPEDLYSGDIILFNYFKPKSTVHHLGVYLGGETFIHHPRRKFSVIEVLDDLYLNWVDSVIRIK
jgi:proteasome lid subunit RPN8/RPN11